MSHNKNQKEVELAIYKDLDVLRADTVKNTIYFVYSSATQKVTQIWVTSDKNIPRKVELAATINLKTITSPNGTIEVVETPTEIQLELEASILAQINSALQSGDNISELINDANYITIGDVPPFLPSDYDLEEFTNNGVDPYAHQSEITSGVTNLSYTASPTQGTVNSDTGTGAVVPLADLTNAGLLSPAEKAEIATALQPGDVTQYTDEQAQDAVGTILLDTVTIDLTYNDGTSSISADVKPNSIDATHLSNTINVSEFVNDSGYAIGSYVDGKVIDSIADADTTHAPSRNAVFDALALKGDMTTTTAQTVSGVKTFLTGMFGLRNVANTVTSFFTNTNTASRTYTLQDRTGTLAMLDDFIPQITITTSVSITTATNDINGVGQNGRNVIIDNGVNTINYTINAITTSSFTKHGTGVITFVQGIGRTLIQADATTVLNGAVGSTAVISSVGTTDYLYITNR